MFSQRDIERHRQRKKEVSGLYSNNSLYNLEKPVDGAIEALFEKLSGFTKTDVAIDLFDWFHYFTFDSIGLLTVWSRILLGEKLYADHEVSSLGKPLVSFRPERTLAISWKRSTTTHAMVL